MDPELAMASTGEFPKTFAELRDSVQHMTKLTRRAHYVLHVLMRLKEVKTGISQDYVVAETEAIAARRKQECALLLDGSHADAP